MYCICWYWLYILGCNTKKIKVFAAFSKVLRSMDRILSITGVLSYFFSGGLSFIVHVRYLQHIPCMQRQNSLGFKSWDLSSSGDQLPLIVKWRAERINPYLWSCFEHCLCSFWNMIVSLENLKNSISDIFGFIFILTIFFWLIMFLKQHL